MNAKPCHLITFLGVNDYIPIHYKYDNTESILTKYIQTAIVDIMNKRGRPFERVIVFATKQAEQAHLAPLTMSLERISPTTEVKKVSIPSGSSKDEIEVIFSAMLENLSLEYEIYIDITHGFRSIPFIAMSAIIFAWVVREVDIERILYGAADKLGTWVEIESMREEDRIAPILDLTQFFRYLKWANAVTRFLKAGDAKDIQENITMHTKEPLKKTRGGDVEARQVRGLGTCAQVFTHVLKTCRSRDFPKAYRNLRKAVEAQKEKQCGNAPVKEIFSLLERDLAGFADRSDEDLLFKGAEWCFKRGLIQQAYTILFETANTVILKECGVQDPFKRQMREIVGSAIRKAEGVVNFKREQKRPKEQESDLNDKEILEKITKWLVERKDLLSTLVAIRNIRNDFNHAGTNKEEARGCRDFFDQFDRLYKNITQGLSVASKS